MYSDIKTKRITQNLLKHIGKIFDEQLFIILLYVCYQGILELLWKDLCVTV